MKIKAVVSLLIVSITVLLFSSCDVGGENDVYITNASKICVNYQGTTTLSFNLVVLSRKKIQNIKYAGLEGEACGSVADVTIIDNSGEELKKHICHGWHINNYMIEISYKDKVETCTMEKMIFNIDDSIEKVSFQIAPQREQGAENFFSDTLQPNVFPNEFPSSFINYEDKSAEYVFTAKEDLTITGIRFKDFLNCTNVSYSIDGDGYQPASFPISVKQGETVKMLVSFGSTVADEMCYVLTDIYFDFTTASDETVSSCGGAVVFDPIYPLYEDDMSKLDRLVENLAA